MSGTITINAIIDKLLQQPNRINPLQFNSVKSKVKLKELKERITDLYIPETSFAVLSTFLQNTSLSIFTDEELIVLLKFDYSFIENKTITTNQSQQNLNKPYYDSLGTVINVEVRDRLKINTDFKFLHTINSTLSTEFLISFLLAQI